jgi:hypothetical protein
MTRKSPKSYWNSDQYKQLLQHAQHAHDQRLPVTIVLALGTNDATKSTWDLQAFTDDYLHATQVLLALPCRPSLVIAVPPNIQSKCKMAIQSEVVNGVLPMLLPKIAMAGRKPLRVIDCSEALSSPGHYTDDGCHPTASGYRRLAETVAGWLQHVDAAYPCRVFQNLVSVGSKCMPAYHLRRMQLQKQALPFDWCLNNEGLSYVNDCINTQFAHAFSDLSYDAEGHVVAGRHPSVSFLHQDLLCGRGKRSQAGKPVAAQAGGPTGQSFADMLLEVDAEDFKIDQMISQLYRRSVRFAQLLNLQLPILPPRPKGGIPATCPPHQAAVLDAALEARWRTRWAAREQRVEAAACSRAALSMFYLELDPMNSEAAAAEALQQTLDAIGPFLRNVNGTRPARHGLLLVLAVPVSVPCKADPVVFLEQEFPALTPEFSRLKGLLQLSSSCHLHGATCGRKNPSQKCTCTFFVETVHHDKNRHGMWGVDAEWDSKLTKFAAPQLYVDALLGDGGQTSKLPMDNSITLHNISLKTTDPEVVAAFQSALGATAADPVQVWRMAYHEQRPNQQQQTAAAVSYGLLSLDGTRVWKSAKSFRRSLVDAAPPGQQVQGTRPKKAQLPQIVMSEAVHTADRPPQAALDAAAALTSCER